MTNPLKRQEKKLQRLFQRVMPREREVFYLMVKGLRNRAIAGLLHISTKTLDIHRSQIYTKLGLGRTTALLVWAYFLIEGSK